MTDEHPEDLKERGNEAFKREDYSAALRHYSAAIEASAHCVDCHPHVYYNNRAVVYLKLLRYRDALADAEASLSSNPSYGKAHISKGRAMRGEGRSAEGIAAWGVGLDRALASGDTKTAEALKQLIAEARGHNTGNSGNSGSSGSADRGSSGGGGRGASTSGSGSSRPASKLLTAVQYTRYLMLAAAISYLLPMGWASMQAWMVFLFAAAASHVMLVVNDCGTPKFTAEYAQQAFQSLWLPTCFTPVILIGARPTIFGLIAAGGIDIFAALCDIHKSGKLGPINPLLEKAAAFALPYVSMKAPEVVARMTTREKWEAANSGTLRLMALMEVILAIMFVFEILTPMRNIVVTFIMWQTLQLKFTLSEYTRDAFTIVHQRLMALTLHPMCPGLIRNGYAKLSTFLRSQVRTMEEAQQEAAARAADGNNAAAGGLSGLMSRCTIQ